LNDIFIKKRIKEFFIGFQVAFFEKTLNYLPDFTVQQIENHGNKHWAHYVGLVESDER
jgi:hypothetical protein